MTVIIDDRRFRIAIKRLIKDVNNTRPLMRKIGMEMRDFIRDTITLQGRSRQYKPLSPWTRARTGRRKALLALRLQINFTYTDEKAEVFHASPSTEWNATLHHTGFNVRQTVLNPPKRMIVPAHRGGVLAVFTKRKAFRVPARQVWPTGNQAQGVAREAAIKFITRAARRWR